MVNIYQARAVLIGCLEEGAEVFGAEGARA